MNNNLFDLFSMLNSGFNTNKNMTNDQYVEQNGQNRHHNFYGQSFPEEAYQNGQNVEQNSFSMNPNIFSMLLSMLNKNTDLSSLSSILSNKSSFTENSQKKSPPQDDDIII